MGTQSWFPIPTFLCSRVFRNAASGKANFKQEHGKAESKRIGMLNLRFCVRDDTVMSVLRGEVEWGIVDETQV